MDLVNVYKNNKINDNIVLEGWIRNHRPQKEYGFIDFFDGTCFESIQVVYDNTLDNFEDLTHLLVGSAIKVEGTLVESQGKQDTKVVVSGGLCNSVRFLFWISCPASTGGWLPCHFRKGCHFSAFLCT